MRTPVAYVTNLRLKFPGAADLQFKDFSLSVAKGEKVLLLGPSGCGKSTLLQVLTGIIPHSVEVPMKTEDILIPDEWGYVFQDPDSQFCMPYVDEELAFVLENLQVPREQMPALIDHYLQLVGLRLTDRHTPIQSLSQGMKQRLAVASVLALQPDMLLLDEPTALLDPEGTKQVWETIKQVGNDKTILIVEHKIDHIIDFVDRIVVLDAAGRIIGDGPKQDIFSRHKEDFRRFGIWYPEVWDDYLEEKLQVHMHASLPLRTESAIAGLHADTELQTGSTSSSLQADIDPQPRSEKLSADETPVIELRDFVAYRGKTPVTTCAECMLSAAEWVTVVGENGAGKSTLLLGLMQLIRTSGHYAIHGTPASDIRNLSDVLAFVFQNPEFQFVTNRTRDEIAYTLQLNGFSEEKTSGIVNRLLEQFDLYAQQELHPYQLSMGQKRRLSVASAVVMEQPVLLLDEPTFGQDARSTFAILEKLEQWRERGTTIIMVTHDMRIVQHFATQVWHVEGGQVTVYSDPAAYLRLADHGDTAAADDNAYGKELMLR